MPTTVVVAEDDEDNRLLIKQAFTRCQGLDLHFAHNGLELLEYLKSGELTKPCLILLDLKMPKMGGIEAFERIKSDDRLKDIPIILMTESDDENILVRSYSIGVSSYIRKAMLFKELEYIVSIIGRYWCEIVLPPGKPKISDIQTLDRYFQM